MKSTATVFYKSPAVIKLILQDVVTKQVIKTIIKSVRGLHFQLQLCVTDNRLKCGRISLKEDPCQGRPKSASIPRNQ